MLHIYHTLASLLLGSFIGTDIARIDGRLDGFEQRLQRIEKRLELIEA
jgi:hypothetical protein